MSKRQLNIVGLGELLFDILPSGQKMPGGASANFAYIASQLGNRGIVASRVGLDADGAALLESLERKGVDVSFVQKDERHETGTVKVALKDGQPDYEITENVAWDFIELSDDWRVLAKDCDAVCFGSLAQRNEVSQASIQEFVRMTKDNCLRIFDVNLRQEYFSSEILSESLNLANVVKLNHEELPRIAALFSIEGADEIEKAKKLREKFALRIVCVTRGANGSLLITKDEVSAHPGIKVEIANAIGAGDAFTATLACGLLRRRTLDNLSEAANKIGAFVASKQGAMPDFSGF